MENRIQIRHGTTAPTTNDLLPYELGWSDNTDLLYINDGNNIVPVQPSYPISVNNGGTGMNISPSMKVNLSSNAAVNILTNSPRPGVEGLLNITYGGTNANTAKAGIENLFADGCDIDIYNYGANASDVVLECKNLLPNTASTKTANGVTFTVNSDGSVLVNGTASALTFLGWQFSIKKGDYILNGAPTGGQLTIRNAEGGSAPQYFSGQLDDYGSGASFSVSQDTTAYMNIRVASGTTLSNAVFKPMIRDAFITNADYVPYAKTNRQLTVDEITATEIQNITGPSSVIPITYGGTNANNRQDAILNLTSYPHFNNLGNGIWLWRIGRICVLSFNGYDYTITTDGYQLPIASEVSARYVCLYTSAGSANIPGTITITQGSKTLYLRNAAATIISGTRIQGTIIFISRGDYDG